MQLQKQAQILIEIKQTIMYRYVQKQKTLFTQGQCIIAKNKGFDNTAIKINNFYLTLTKQVFFAKIIFHSNVSYLFPHFDSGMIALTIQNTRQVINNFDSILGQISTLSDYSTAMEDQNFSKKIQLHCPNVEKQPIVSQDRIKYCIKIFGQILQKTFKISGEILAKGISKLGYFIYGNISSPQIKQNVDPNLKNKWITIKKGTNDVLDLSKGIYQQYVNPLIGYGVQRSKDLATKIDQSDHNSVKYAKQLAVVAGAATTNAFNGLTQGVCNALNQLDSQTRKIVNKRFGEDYVNTFLPKVQEKKDNENQYHQLEGEEKSEHIEVNSGVEEREQE